MEPNDLMLQLHNGDINLLEYLDTKALAMGLGPANMNSSASDRNTGITPRVTAYCIVHGLGTDGFLDIVWKANKRRTQFRYSNLLMKTKHRIHDR